MKTHCAEDLIVEDAFTGLKTSSCLKTLSSEDLPTLGLPIHTLSDWRQVAGLIEWWVSIMEKIGRSPDIKEHVKLQTGSRVGKKDKEFLTKKDLEFLT